MQRYLITGGLGFLGQYIVQAIHDHDPQCEVRVLVRTPRRTYLPIRALERVSFVNGDLSQSDSSATAHIFTSLVARCWRQWNREK